MAFVAGTGSAMDVHVPPLGLDWVSQLTTKGMYNFPPLKLIAWQDTGTPVILKTPLPVFPFIEPLTSPQVSRMPPHGPGSKFRNGGSVVGRIPTEHTFEPPFAGVSFGFLPSLARKMPMSQRLGTPELTVTSRSTTMMLPPMQNVGPPGAIAMPVIETSLAVQFRLEANRDAAHCCVPNA